MSGWADRLQRLRDDEADAKRDAKRLLRLLQRQMTKRKRLTKAIAATRRRIERASARWNEVVRAISAIGGIQ